MSIQTPVRPTIQRHRIDPTRDERPNIPANRRNPRFAYIHYPHGWEYVAEINPATGEAWGFLPKLKKVQGVAGANGVRGVGRGANARIDMSGAISGHIQQGATYINPSDPRLGEEYQFYVGYVETSDGGKHFTEPGEDLILLPGGRVLPNSDEAVNLHRKFQKHIMESGMIAAMLPEVKALLVEQATTKANRVGGRIHNNPHLEKRYQRWLAIAAGAERDWPAYVERFHAGTSTSAASPAKSVRRAARKRVKTDG